MGGRRPSTTNEFSLYETWVDAAAVEQNESGEAFRWHKDALRPLVDPDSLVFGNAAPVTVLGYAVCP